MVRLLVTRHKRVVGTDDNGVSDVVASLELIKDHTNVCLCPTYRTYHISVYGADELNITCFVHQLTVALWCVEKIDEMDEFILGHRGP